MHLAAFSGHADAVALLLGAGARVNAKDYVSSWRVFCASRLIAPSALAAAFCVCVPPTARQPSIARRPAGSDDALASGCRGGAKRGCRPAPAQRGQSEPTMQGKSITCKFARSGLARQRASAVRGERIPPRVGKRIAVRRKGGHRCTLPQPTTARRASLGCSWTKAQTSGWAIR